MPSDKPRSSGAVERLRDTVGILRGSAARNPAVLSAADELDDAIAGIDVAVRAAANLPLVKRKRAHFQLDHLLDELEGRGVQRHIELREAAATGADLNARRLASRRADGAG